MLINISDDLIRLHDADLLDELLLDRTTKRNILWATDAYTDLGPTFERNREIFPELVTGKHVGVVKTRARKAFEQQSERTRKRAEVFTPLWIVQKMCDHADQVWFGRKDGFSKTDSAGHIRFTSRRTWKQYVENRRMELTCGEAPYLTTRYDVETGEIIPLEQRTGLLDRKLRAVNENAAPEEWQQWAYKAMRSTYGYEFQGDSLLIARVNVLMAFAENMEAALGRKPDHVQFKQVIHIITRNLWQMDGLTDCIPYAQLDEEQLALFDPNPKPPPDCRIYDWRQQKSRRFSSLKGGDAKMKFDFIIGNPPYQEDTASESTRMLPIYNFFMDQAYSVADVVELITPARFLFNAGQTPKTWNQKMLDDPHLKVLFFEQDASKIFANTDIKGGVAITLRNSNKHHDPIRAYVPYSELRSILEKAGAKRITDSLTDIADSSNVYDLKGIYTDHPDYRQYIGDGGRHSQLKTNVLNINPIFTDIPTEADDFVIFGLVNGKRGKKYCHRRYIKSEHKSLFKYKVLVPKAAGSGKFGDSFPEMIVVEPEVAFTQTYISIGTFESEIEAINLSKYIKTKFCRALLYVLKVTQDNLPGSWRYIPKQDFTPASDIDWSKSIPEIDRQLYAKYGLDEKEIEFIETHVKEMS